MTQTHPITPPPELVDKLFMLDNSEEGRLIAAYRVGADQELEACCEWLDTKKILTKDGGYIRKLRAASRPKPPSLKEQAMAQLQTVEEVLNYYTSGCIVDTIRRALESLDD